MASDYIAIVQSIVLKHVDKSLFAVFLFGSRSKRLAKHGADIDIGIWGSENFPSKTINKIIEEVAESIVPYDLDVVDFFISDKKFRQIALKSYQLWNLPKHLQQNFIL